MSAARCARRAVAGRHDGVEPREGVDLALAQRRIASTSRSAGASFAGVQSSWRNSGTTFSPSTRLARMTEDDGDPRPRRSTPRRRRPCRPPPSARRRARAPASPCPIWRSAACALRNAARFSASPTTTRGCTGQSSAPPQSVSCRCGMVGSTGSNAMPCGPQLAERLAEHRHVVPDLAAPAAGQHQQQRRLRVAARLLVGRRAAARRSARSGDDRHRCRADRPAGDAPPARTAAAPARDRHSRAWRGRGPAATPRPTARHNRRSESTASFARTRRATRWVKSGLSMMTRISGAAASTASAVSRMRRRISRQLPRPRRHSPMIDSSSIGNSDTRPSRAMARPPTPSKRTAPPSRCRSTFIRLAPSRSPDSSAATRKILRSTRSAARSAITPAAR